MLIFGIKVGISSNSKIDQELRIIGIDSLADKFEIPEIKLVGSTAKTAASLAL